MNNMNTNGSHIEEIPSEIMLDILSRLPTKTCLKCKLVCKEWYEIITSDEFDARRSSYTTMLLRAMSYSNRIDFLLIEIDKSSKVDDDGNLIVGVDAMMRFKSKITVPYQKLIVVNECNGLICLISYHKWYPYIILNLLTGEQVIVNQEWRSPSCLSEVYGLGCCPVSGQYKVVRIIDGYHGRVAEIQTLGTNEWRTLGDVPMHRHVRDDKSNRVFLHGSLHVYSRQDNCIWGFHFGDEQFMQIPTPDEIEREREYSCLSVFDSCLCFTSSLDNQQCGIWLMKEYGVKDSWVKQFVIEMVPIIIPHMHLLGLRMDTEDILVYSCHGTCDDKSKNWKLLRVLVPKGYH
ncbi:hypothetical protein RDABS01_012453 [Bienertia sinuspersici]